MLNMYSLSDNFYSRKPIHTRISYLDTAKGVLIILVILGHVFFKAKYMNFVYTFHLSSFFIISGMLFFYTNKINRSSIGFIKNALYTLIVPFLFFETIGGIVKKAMYPEIPLIQLLTSPFKDSYSYHVPADWYLLTAFFSEALFICVEKMFDNRLVKIVIYISLYIVGFALPRNGRYFPLAGRTLIATLLIACGYYLYDIFTNIDKGLILIAIALVVCCTMINGYVSLYSITIKDPLCYLIGTISGAYVCISLCHLQPIRVLSVIGQNSLIIMGTHQLFLSYLHVSSYLLLLIIALVEIPIIFVLKKYLPFCVGIKKPRH